MWIIWSSGIKQPNCLKSYLKLYLVANLISFFKTSCRLSNYFHFRDHPCTDLISRIVYKFSCGCCNASHFSQTKRHFEVRMCEHMGVPALTNRVSSSSGNLTAIRDHVSSFGHIVSSDNFSIHSHVNSSYLLELKESLFILRDNPDSNRIIRSAPLYLYN